VEGLVLAARLDALRALLPARRLAWRFEGATTLLLPLVPDGTLRIDLDPRGPALALESIPTPGDPPTTPFQRALAARAAGPLDRAEQIALDRRLELRFGPSEGFVPVPAVTLVVELTGRNANALLLDDEGRISAVHREVPASRNRHRQLLPGLAYRPPPPYDKLDPRRADRGVLKSVLRGRPLAKAFQRIDGVGTSLVQGWAALAGVDEREPLEGAALDAALAALPRLVTDPDAALAAAGLAGEEERPNATRRALEEAARAALADRRKLLERRVGDVERALAAADDAERLRAEGDLLLARAHLVPRGAANVALEGFDGGEARLVLDPRLDAAGNARHRYDQARRREARAERALAQHDAARAELALVEARLEALEGEADDALRELLPERRRGAAARSVPPGLRVEGPHGFEVVLGRSARENDLVTFRVGRSEDVWLHAQGYHGAHVVIRSGGREVPFDTVLFAARLAAGHSDAGQSDNVPVDYTLRKHVWRSRGAPAGAVSYAQQKTVFVTPLRRSQVA
jgi:predicted ribosome quality control (RQC) complex YloA/Tae2 family protein